MSLIITESYCSKNKNDMILSFGTTAAQGPNQSGPHLNSERENSSAVCQLKTGWCETKVSEFRSQIHVPVFVIVVIKITFLFLHLVFPN